ncbi:protein of unknown function [Candidatus Methylocalor cossyra]|uniref:Uncharacterized protein n=1 Tax=Candidatus Methylocalor cossyra TaxID=3108543 RepID=A0ABM9NKQ6_9GAMM
MYLLTHTSPSLMLGHMDCYMTSTPAYPVGPPLGARHYPFQARTFVNVDLTYTKRIYIQASIMLSICDCGFQDLLYNMRRLLLAKCK